MKKFIRLFVSVWISACLLFNLLSVATLAAAPSVAELVAIGIYDGIFESGEAVEASYIYNGDEPEGATTFQWQYSTSSGGSYTNIAGATGKTYTIQNQTNPIPGKYLRVAVTPADTTGAKGSISYSTPQLVATGGSGANGGLGLVGRINSRITGFTATTPDTNVFSLANDPSGASFILLDHSGRDASKFFILTKDHYGTFSSDAGSQNSFDPDNTQKFDSEDPNNVAYWINNVFAVNGNPNGAVTYQLPDEIKANINFDHYWRTEAGRAGVLGAPNVDSGYPNPPSVTSCPDDYKIKAGVALLSQTELIAHAPKIGFVDSMSAPRQGWLLRTARGDAGSARVLGARIDGDLLGQTHEFGASLTAGASISTLYLRPAFHLNKDFFKTVKLNLATIGDNVKQMIVSMYTEDEMNIANGGLYTIGELAALGFPISGSPPYAINVSISGEAYVGNTLTGSYEYVSDDDTEEQGTALRWLSSADDITYSTISGQTGSTFFITPEYVERHIKFEVIPIDSVGFIGAAAGSAPTALVPRMLGPMDRNMAIPNFNTNTPPENKFQISGTDREFILLDTTDNDASKYFILAKDDYGTYVFDPDRTQRFDITDPNNIAYFLNNSFKNVGNAGKKLPEQILANINYNHSWITEAGWPTGNCPYDYFTTAGLALLSQTEVNKYYPKFGLTDNLTAGWWIRTGRGLNSDEFHGLYMNDSTRVGQVSFTHTTETRLIRPAFYLNKSFFETTRLNLTNLGDNVKAAIRQSYTKGELLGLYTKAELENELGYNEDFVISGVTYKTLDGSTTITDLTTATEILVTSTVESSMNDGELVMLVGLFSGDNRLLAANTVKGAVLANGSVDLSVGFSFPTVAVIDSDCDIKIMLVDSLWNIIPRTRMHTFK